MKGYQSRQARTEPQARSPLNQRWQRDIHSVPPAPVNTQSPMQAKLDTEPSGGQPANHGQELAGAITSLQRSKTEPGATPDANAPIQRMVAISKAVSTENFVELTSINYGVKRAGGPVVYMAQADFSSLGEEDRLYIVAHGAPGSSGDYTGEEIANYLTHPGKGLKASIAEIKFTSCYAGKGEVLGDEIDSVVAVITHKLSSAGLGGIQVSGAKGPSVKSHEVGDEYAVINPKQPVSDISGLVQSVQEIIHDPKGKTAKALKVKRKQKGAPLTIEEKAQIASEVTGQFYKDFMWALNNPVQFAGTVEGMIGTDLVDNATTRGLVKDLRTKGPLLLKQSMTRMTSLSLVEEKQSQPQSSSSSSQDNSSNDNGDNGGSGKKCFITGAVLFSLMAPDDCRELTVLRQFRDGFLRYMPAGNSLISRYYDVAPEIDTQITSREDAPVRYRSLFTHIDRAVNMVETGNYQMAYQIYIQQIRELEEEYLMGGGDEGEGEADA